MGVDVHLTLPPATRIRDVADVAAALLGNPVSRHDLGGGGYSMRTIGWKYNTHSDMPECCSIDVESTVTQHGAHIFYHNEWDRHGNRGTSLRCRPEWIALSVALCDFFGGSVDFNDCDGNDDDYTQPPRPDIHASDGDEWDTFQDRKLAVKPLSKSDIAKYKKHAVYE